MVKKKRTNDKAERGCHYGHLSSNNSDSNNFDKTGPNYLTFARQLFKNESSITSKSDQMYVDHEFVDTMYLIDIIIWFILYSQMKTSVLLTYTWHFLQSIIILMDCNIWYSINYRVSYSQYYVFCFVLLQTTFALLYYSFVKNDI